MEKKDISKGGGGRAGPGACHPPAPPENFESRD